MCDVICGHPLKIDYFLTSDDTTSSTVDPITTLDPDIDEQGLRFLTISDTLCTVHFIVNNNTQ